jgi:hypothetical protein
VVEYGRAKPRTIAASFPARDMDEMVDERFVFVSAKDAGSLMLDLQTGASRDVGVAQLSYARRGNITVIVRNDHMIVLDGATERDLGAVEQYPMSFRTGHYLFVDPLVVDLDTGALVGHAPAGANVQALDATGRLLIGTGGRTGRDFAGGPLRWVSPVP